MTGDRASWPQRLRGTGTAVDGWLRTHRKAVTAVLVVAGLGLAALLGAAAWTVVVDLRSERAAAIDPRKAYVERVQEKIQRTTEAALAGKPPRAVPATLQLRIVVNPDGGLASVSVERTSGDAGLDELALRIVRTAAPFGAFPADMRRTTRIVVLTSDFHFH